MTLGEFIQGYEEQVIDELMRWWENLFYIQGRDKLADILKQYLDTEYNENDTLSVSYTMEFVQNDIAQIVGGLKRPKKNIYFGIGRGTNE